MAADQVTTGQELNSYKGDANLASGSNYAGYAPLVLDPLQTYALNKYKTNLIDYEQQQKDKALLQEKFYDPNINLKLDKEFAEQIQPAIDKFKDSAKLNLQMNPDSDEWYDALATHEKLLKDNAALKTVQNLKDDALKKAGETADQHDKEVWTAYADKLSKYKLGEEIPAYSKYFAPVDKHVPTGEITTGTYQRQSADGKYKQTVKKTINNPMGLPKKYDRMAIDDPTAYKTWGDISHTLLENGGINELNKAAAETYKASMALNTSNFQEKYKSQWDEFHNKYPGLPYSDFIAATGLTDELSQIQKGNAFLKVEGKDAVPVEKVPAEANHLSGYTYFTDPKDGKEYRLNKSDKVIAAMHGATAKLPGQSEEVLKSELDETPAKIELLKAQALKAKSDANANMIKAKAARAKVNAQIAKLKEGTEQDTYFSELWDRNPQEQKLLAFTDGNQVISNIPAESSLPIYTIKGDKVTELIPKGAQKVYDKVNEDGSPATGAKVTGYTGGSYHFRYVKPGSNTALSDKQLLNAYNNSVAKYGEISFDDFVKGAIKNKAFDYVIEGENGIVDRKLALAAQKKVSNASQKKGQGGIFDDSEDLTIDPNDITE